MIPKPSVNAESILAIDFGSVTTRALLFDVVEGQFHFIASGTAPSTVGAPFYDLGEGLHFALEDLTSITGRLFTDPESGHLILPMQSDGSGVDRLVASISAGKRLNVFASGLLDEVSLSSAKRLASSTYGDVVIDIGLGDRRSLEDQVDAILQARTELILLVGGTEGGASRSISRAVELIGMVCRMLPKPERPVVVFAGNSALGDKVKEVVEKMTNVYVAPNIRPSIDTEDLGPGMKELAEIVGLVRTQQIGGLVGLGKISSTPLLPTAYAFGRMVRFFSRIYRADKPVLGVDLGARSTTLAVGTAGELSLNVYPYGMGQGVEAAINDSRLSDFMQWVTDDISEQDVLDALWNKRLYPGSIPMTSKALDIELALARQNLHLAMQRLLESQPDLVPQFEPIIITGAVLSHTPTRGKALLALLDGLQPVGVSTVAIDPNGILAASGTIADINALLPAQVADSGALVSLGTIICPLCNARRGTSILRARLEYDNGRQIRSEIKQGTIVSMPLPAGHTAHLNLEPLQTVYINPEKRSGVVNLKVTGGACGVVIDARGRPIQLPKNTEDRSHLLTQWRNSLDR
jgi:hypothetical protein